jgi:hypothetical protein
MTLLPVNNNNYSCPFPKKMLIRFFLFADTEKYQQECASLSAFLCHCDLLSPLSLVRRLLLVSGKKLFN